MGRGVSDWQLLVALSQETPPCDGLVEALDVVLCYGWIDGIRKGLDRDGSRPKPH